MLKTIALFVLVLVINVNGFAKNISTYSDTTVLPQILALNLSSYIGKPLDSLFNVLPSNFTDRGFKPMGIGYARGVTQGYGLQANNHVFVEIFIDQFRFMPFPNRTKTTTWDMNLARKETISFIKIWKNNSCVYGCNNPSYTD